MKETEGNLINNRRKEGMTKIGAASLVLLLVTISFISSVAVGHLRYGTSTTAFTSTTTTTYAVAWTFYVIVNYSGNWNLNYQGFASSNIYNPTDRGSINGSGIEMNQIAVNGSLTTGVSLCVLIQKKDNSTNNLFGAVYIDKPEPGELNYAGNTTMPYGMVGLCTGVGPY